MKVKNITKTCICKVKPGKKNSVQVSRVLIETKYSSLLKLHGHRFQ